MLKKTALLLSAALAFAAPSFGQLLVNGGATTNVTLVGNQPGSVNVTSASPVTFTATQALNNTFVLNISPTSATTNTTIYFSVQNATCANVSASNCSQTITLTDDANPSNVATINVSYTNSIGGGGGSGPFYASTNTVTLTQGGNSSVTLYNNTSGAITYSLSTPTASWLQVFPASGNTNIAANGSAALNIYALNYTAGQPNPATFTASSGNTVVTVTVTLSGVGTSGGLVPSQSSLSLAYPGSPASGAVTVTNGTGNTSTTFYAVATTSSGGQWMSLYPGGGATSTAQGIGNQVLVAVNGVASGLSTGTYYGTVTLYDGNTFQALGSFTVTLSVNGASGTGGVAAPTALTFAYQSGYQPTTNPYQIILVNGGVTNATFVATGGSWTNSSVVPSFNGASNQVYVSVPSGLPASGSASVNTGTVTVTNASGLTQSIPVTLTVYPTGSPTLLVSGLGNYTCTYTTGQQICGSAAYSISASDSSSVSISPSSSVSWATVSCSSSSTPAICTVGVSPTGLPNGLNTGLVTVTGTNTTNGSVQIPIAVLVSGSSGGNGGFLTFSPTSLTFTTPVNSQATQSVSVTATQGGTVIFNYPTTDQSWLGVSSSNFNTTPSTFTVTVNTAGLQNGLTYTGNVNVIAGGVQQQIPVTLTVGSGSGGNVTVTAGNSPGGATVTSMSFTTQPGGAAPNAQQIYVASASGVSGGSFNFSATTTSGGNWLLINNAISGSSTTPNSLTVTVNPSGLAASTTYGGNIAISPSGGTTVNIPVSFTVTPSQTVSASPTSLTFSYTAGSGVTPTAQTISVSGTGTFSVTTTGGGNWCQVNPTSGTAPGTITVAVTNLDSLAVNQSYTCTITVAGTNGTAGSTTITTTLTVSAPLPTILKVTNAASFNAGSISAGEIITIFGTNMGPTTGVSASPTNNMYPTTLGGVQVLLAGGYPAAMIYASATQVSAVVPYEINRPVFLQSVNVQVKYLGQTSNGVPLTQVAAAPGIFTANSSGSGPGAILNSNLSVNSSSNPATSGSTVVLYVTGEGQTIPAGVTGQVSPLTPPFIVPVQAPTVTINGQPAQVAFYAESPGLIAGVLQINVVIPASAGTGDLPVVVSFGSASSQLTSTGVGAVTVSVR